MCENSSSLACVSSWQDTWPAPITSGCFSGCKKIIQLHLFWLHKNCSGHMLGQLHSVQWIRVILEGRLATAAITDSPGRFQCPGIAHRKGCYHHSSGVSSMIWYQGSMEVVYILRLACRLIPTRLTMSHLRGKENTIPLCPQFAVGL
jgi:hypothetical protein